MKHTILLYLTFFCLISCEQEDNLEVIDALTVEAFLHAGQNIENVKFSKIIPLDSIAALNAPTDLTPFIINEESNIFPLAYTGEEGIYANTNFTIKEGQVYSLEVTYNESTVRAETFIPPPPKNLTLSDSILYRKQINDFSDLQDQELPDPIEINWNGDEGAYYFVTIVNIESNPESINTLFSGDTPPGFQNILTAPSTNTYHPIDAFRDITHYGTYEIVVFRVNAEYVALYEDNTSGAGSINEIRTNVQNGYGIFTGINSQSIFFEVKKQ